MRFYRYSLSFIVFTFTLFFIQGCNRSSNNSMSNPPLLRVALLPDESASTIISRNVPLKKYLEEKLKKKIELIVTTDYLSMILAAKHSHLDLAYFGPLSYVIAEQQGAPFEPFAILKSNGSASYRSLLIAKSGNSLQSLNDLKNKTVAFGDQASTSSHLIPKFMLQKNGFKAGVNYKEVFLGAHDAVALSVQYGHADIGGISEPIYQDLIRRKIIDDKKVQIIQQSEYFPNYPWTIRTTLDESLKDQIISAFLDISNQEILKAFKGEAFIATKPSEYDPIRLIAKELKLSDKDL
jgi:phosphonate transport system substrate-binding protein